MKRIIKFRAWDKADVNVYDSPTDSKRMSFYGGDFTMDDNQNSLNFITPEGKQAPFGDHGSMERYELMQYTEIEDFHGKPIYEGDIVKTGDEMGEVQYDSQQGAYIILLYPHNKKVKSGCYNLASTHPSLIKEIIGNIYMD